jgi:DNA-binding transcriptional MerR regulator
MKQMTIKHAAASSGVTAETLRQYERAGLLNPVRDSNGNRLFSETDVEKARQIAAERRSRSGFRGLAAAV